MNNPETRNIEATFTNLRLDYYNLGPVAIFALITHEQSL